MNLYSCIRTNAELTKIYSDKCRTYKKPFGQMQNLQKIVESSDKCMRLIATSMNLYSCILVRNIGLSNDNSYKFQFIDFTTAERAI